jgi:hypothetical protein
MSAWFASTAYRAVVLQSTIAAVVVVAIVAILNWGL